MEKYTIWQKIDLYEKLIVQNFYESKKTSLQDTTESFFKLDIIKKFGEKVQNWKKVVNVLFKLYKLSAESGGFHE